MYYLGKKITTGIWDGVVYELSFSDSIDMELPLSDVIYCSLGGPILERVRGTRSKSILCHTGDVNESLFFLALEN